MRGRVRARTVALGALPAIVVLVLLALVPAAPAAARAEEEGGGTWDAGPEQFESIPAYDVVLMIATNGDLHVRETITYDFARGGEHGIVRRLPYRRGDRLFEIRDVRTSSSTGAPARARTRKLWHDLLITVGDDDRTVHGRQAYVIEYTVSGAFTPGAGHDELDWDVLGTSWEVPIREAAVRVEAPVVLRKARCRSGTGEAVTGCLRDRDGPYAIDFTQSGLRPRESMRVTVLLPKGAIAVPPPLYARPHWAVTWAGSGLLLLALAGLATVAGAARCGRTIPVHGGRVLLALGGLLVAADVSHEVARHGVWALSVGDASMGGVALAVVGAAIVSLHRFRMRITHRGPGERNRVGDEPPVRTDRLRRPSVLLVRSGRIAADDDVPRGPEPGRRARRAAQRRPGGR
ncbi:hypothetical protein Acsp04_34120 [Actinomadura sp. NBRC 104425]|uniref:DUF2207 domain-containing protein n=1 Tax=Actinomadura sp. NBRC 104425 TaxID=3032204 RepID=UPI0024A22583|nr:DUF2207 domain-containing protein [Actinomadura sp. NBRC 104425]GLZ13177.1 hypothetical protein Acsp04_34120 [Actinomadura sp. NBRC 104425]